MNELVEWMNEKLNEEWMSTAQKVPALLQTTMQASVSYITATIAISKLLISKMNEVIGKR